MADHTKIEWTDATWNVITGCSVLSAGCRRCYAMRLAGTRLKHHPSRAGLTVDTKAGPVWTGEVRFNKQWALQPLQWGKPRMIFVCAHADLLHEKVPDGWIDHVFAVAALCPQHTFQILTKRAERMRKYFADPIVWARIEVAARCIHRDMTGKQIAGKVLIGPLRNCWLGVSVEDEASAGERMPLLIQTPASIRWVSAEPLLGPTDLTPWLDSINWVVSGGESGHDARPSHPSWFRKIRDACHAAGVPYLHKQHGAWSLGGDSLRQARFEDGTVLRFIGKKAAGRTLDGVIHNAFPTSAVKA